jgi:hypothetical protein
MPQCKIKFCVDLTFIFTYYWNLFMYRRCWEPIKQALNLSWKVNSIPRKAQHFCCNMEPFEVAEATGFAQCPRVSTFKPRCWEASVMHSWACHWCILLDWLGLRWGEVGDSGGATANCIVLPFRCRMIATSVGNSIASSWRIKINNTTWTMRS